MIAPGQTHNAMVTLYIPPNVEVGRKDKITFTSRGSNLASQSAVLTVTSPQSTTMVSKILVSHVFLLRKMIFIDFIRILGSTCTKNPLEVR